MSLHYRLIPPVRVHSRPCTTHSPRLDSRQAAKDDAALDRLLDQIMTTAIAPGAIAAAARSYLSMIQNTSSGLDEPNGSFTMRFQV